MEVGGKLIQDFPATLAMLHVFAAFLNMPARRRQSKLAPGADGAADPTPAALPADASRAKLRRPFPRPKRPVSMDDLLAGASDQALFRALPPALAHAWLLAAKLCAGRETLAIVADAHAPGPAVVTPMARALRVVAITAIERGMSLAGAHADAILCLDGLARSADPAALLAACRAALRPGGFVLFLAHDRDVTPPPASHRHAFSRADLAALLSGVFDHIALIPMRGVAGIVALPEAARGALVFDQATEDVTTAGEALARAPFLLALASAAPLPDLPVSLLVLDAFAPSARLRAEAAEARARAARDHAMIGTVAARIERLEAEIQRLRAVAEDADQAARAWRADQAPLLALAGLGQRVRVLQRAYGAALRQARERGMLSRVLRHHDEKKIAVIAASQLFDRAWYLARYPEVAAGGGDPVRHYVSEGAFLGYDPGPDFSTLDYYALNPDVISAEVNPLEHYILYGQAENRPTRPARRDPASLPGLDAAPAVAPEATGPRIAILSGEADTPGHTYRVLRLAAALRARGATVSVHEPTTKDGKPVPGEKLIERVGIVDLLVIWRLGWSAELRDIVEQARATGARLVLDVDDLMFDGEYASPDLIDGIRTRGLDPAAVKGHFLAVQETLKAMDFAITPTHFLAGEVQRWAIPAFVIPNGFDRENWWLARLARRARDLAGSDGLIRLGYASGTRTHQRDFKRASGAIARLLAARPQCRLVLFRHGPWPTLDIEEFPELIGVEDQIEWRATVPVAELPRELARFDINLAPLEAGNPFCEAKSELKYFEAALAGVPSVCSPTAPFRRAIRDGETGFLAEGEEAWHAALVKLVDDPALRRRIAERAYLHCIWAYGPERREDMAESFLAQVLRPGREAARHFALDIALAARPAPALPATPESEIVFAHDTLARSAATIVVPLYNYAGYVVETLSSIKAQTLAALDLVIVDDASTDASLTVAQDWLAAHHQRFGRALLLRNKKNAGLALTRNAGFAHAETPLVMPFDADNIMLPDCLARCHALIEETGAAFAYPTMQRFGGADDVFANLPYDPIRLAPGNYIDATALVRLAAWAAIGGYHDIRPTGWEDFDFWCRLAEAGLYGVHVDQPLVRYRVHGNSMLRTITNIDDNLRTLRAKMRKRHPWTLEGRAADE